MKALVRLLSIGAVALAAVAANSPAPPIFQLRLVLDAPSAETEQMVAVHKNEDAAKAERLYVQKKVLLDQTALKSSKVTTDKRTGNPLIEITFTTEGRKRFTEVTRENVGRRLAIVIDGRLYSAPKIMTAIPGGRAEVSGSFSEPEARELAAKITESLTKR
jgi:preprotein translocase subunit SecD